MSSVMEAIQERRLGYPGVVAKLDRMTDNEVFGLLGNCREVRRYFEASPGIRDDGTLGPLWKVGDGRPLLASDEPAVIAALGHCASARRRFPKADIPVTENHPTVCGWCEPTPDGRGGTAPAYPLRELEKAIAHGLYFSRLVKDHLLVWDGSDGGTYVRTGPEDGRCQSEAWEAFAGLSATDQKRRVADVLEAVREGVTS